MVDVLVVGAGPVGLATAAELARYGLSVRTVDKAVQQTDKSKALVLWSRTLELLDRSGAGAAFVAAGMQVTKANIIAGSKRLAQITFDQVVSPHPYALMLPQNETERLLELHLSSVGVQIERGIELQSLVDDGASVICTLSNTDGSMETCQAAWVVACDGAHSTVRHQLNLRFEGETLPSDWVLADAHATGIPFPGELIIDFHADGVLAIFPITHDRYRIIADLTAGTDKLEGSDPTLSEVQKILDRRGPGGITLSSPIWLASFHINERKVSDYRSGRVFLAGDSAHIHSPAGGQGMNTGIQDGCNLAWKLALVQRGLCAAEPLLESYSIERSAVGEEVLKSAGYLTRVGVMGGEFKQAIRNHLASLLFGFAAVRHAAAEQFTELSIGYPKSPLTIPSKPDSDGPSAGERAPLSKEGSPVGSGGTPRFALFAQSSQETTSFIARYPHILEPSIRTPFSAGSIWLVRPDGYVAIVVKTERLPEIGSYLDRITGKKP